MRLYLSSYRTEETAGHLLDLAGGPCPSVVISNAVDMIPIAERQAYARKIHDPVAELRDTGLDAVDLDLRDYFGDPVRLERDLAEVGLVWAVGGNAFLLRRAMRQSGLDALLARRLADDSLAYGGWSAGACVAGSTLRGLHLMDEPELVTPGYDREIIWEGMGLADFAIVPHFASDHPEAQAADRAVAYLDANAIAYRTLRDGQAILRRGDRIEVVGAPIG